MYLLVLDYISGFCIPKGNEILPTNSNNENIYRDLLIYAQKHHKIFNMYSYSFWLRKPGEEKAEISSSPGLLVLDYMEREKPWLRKPLSEQVDPIGI